MSEMFLNIVKYFRSHVWAPAFVLSIQLNSFPTFKQFHAPIPNPTA